MRKLFLMNAMAGLLVMTSAAIRAYAENDDMVTCRHYAAIPVALASGQPAKHTVAGELCSTEDERRAGATVQLLIHGATYNHSYWNFGRVDTARAAKASLTTQQSLGSVALGMAALREALVPSIDAHGASQILAQAFPCELLLTNLGTLPFQFECGGLKLKALWGPAVLMGFDGEQTVGVTTTNGSLCLLHSSFAPLPRLLQRTERILRSVCDAENSCEEVLLRRIPATVIDCGDRCRIQG